MNILAIAPKPPYVQVAEGTFTRANSRFSLVDGTAFFDCGADLSAYAGLDSGSHQYLIKVYDDDGYSIQGYVGAVGGGVTLGSNLAPTGCCTDPDKTVASTTVFYCDDIIEATANHFNGRIVIFTSGDLQYQATDIIAYELLDGEGKFTVTALTESPGDNVTFIIV